jgi:CheY-like chemotaxis protein/MinD-like ATPase involved in chromosome partitioning or flagellar assembly
MGKKILVIEDDPIATRLIEYILKQRGYEVLAAPNGLEGLKIAQESRPDLIVLNVMLPGIDGFEVCHRLRTEPRTASSLIMMLSGRARQIDIANGLNMGADDYLTKPAAPSEIVNRIESLLVQKAGSRIVAFIGPRDKAGTTTTVVNVAIALAQMGKRVMTADFCPYEGGVADYLGIKPQDAVRLQEADAFEYRSLEAPLVIHHSGVGVLRIRQPAGESGGVTTDNIGLLDKYREAADYILVDLPFQPTAATRAVLAKCHLAVIVSSSTSDALTGVKSAVTVLRFLGIPQKRIGAVVTDPEGTFPQGELPQIKSYVERNIDVNVLGIIPHQAAAPRSRAAAREPVMLAAPGGPAAEAIRELAQRIAAEETSKNDAQQNGVKRA